MERSSTDSAVTSPSAHPRAASSLANDIKGFLQEPFPEPGTNKLYIHSEADFRVKMAAYLSLCDHDPISPDRDDFPTDVETQLALVQQLVEAMINLDSDDKDAKIPVGRIKKLSPIEFHLMAWALLFEIRDAQRGSVSMPRWGKEWEIEECGSFHERFERVRSVLHGRKAAVSSLFDYSFAKRLALGPTSELLRKKANKALNWKRKVEREKARRPAGQAQPDPPRSGPEAGTHRPYARAATAPSTSQGQAGQRGGVVGHSTHPHKRQKVGEHATGIGPEALISPHMGHGGSSTTHASFSTGPRSAFLGPPQTRQRHGSSRSTVRLQPSPLSNIPMTGMNASLGQDRRTASDAVVAHHPQPTQLPMPADRQWLEGSSFMNGSGYQHGFPEDNGVDPQGKQGQWSINTCPTPNETMSPPDFLHDAEPTPYHNDIQTPDADNQQPYHVAGFYPQRMGDGRTSQAMAGTQVVASSPRDFLGIQQWLDDTLLADEPSHDGLCGR